MGAMLIVLPWGGEDMWTQKARTTPGRKAMKVREKSCVSAPSCHLQKTWRSLSRLFQSCPGRLQKLYCWHSGFAVLKV